ncbi:MAG: hypothetical protein M1113_05225 [Candidatus Thermoplasmatota archaeon]|nr:hypothetical protein [Candidatus Thermoplasmatota archaeon]
MKEALEISPKVSALARKVLTDVEIKKADCISLLLVGKRTKNKGIMELKNMIGYQPKRPLYYALFEIDHLPHWTRDAVRYLCDYVDQLCKHWAYICTQNEAALKGSMGTSLSKIKKDTGKQYSNLISILEEYNNVFYVPSKHDFRLPKGRKEHRITSKEVVYSAFITINVAHLIREITGCDLEMECHNGDQAEHTL